MAKAKKTEKVEEVNPDSWREKWITQYGDIFIPAEQVASKENKIISICPSLDIALNGGIVEHGSLVVSGPPKGGKTTLSLQIARNAALMYGKKTYYIDAEGRFKQLNLSTINGFQRDKFELIQSNPEHILNSEQFLGITIDIIKSCPNSIVVIDSLSSLCSEKEQLEDLTPQTRNLNPKIIASFYRKIGTVLPINNVLVIAILHIIANTGYGNQTWAEDSGNSVQFAADTKLRIKYKGKWNDNKDKQIGQNVKFEISCSSLGPPQDNIESWIKFGYGFDECFEAAKLSQDLGFASKKGAWITLDLEDWKYETKFCGDLAMAEYLRANSAALNELLDLIYDSCGVKRQRIQMETQTLPINEPISIPSGNQESTEESISV